MKKYAIAAIILSVLFALVACGGNSDEPTPPAEIVIQNENTPADAVGEQPPTENILAEELKIQIDVATDELLSTFTNLHRVDIRIRGIARA